MQYMAFQLGIRRWELHIWRDMKKKKRLITLPWTPLHAKTWPVTENSNQTSPKLGAPWRFIFLVGLMPRTFAFIIPYTCYDCIPMTFSEIACLSLSPLIKGEVPLGNEYVWFILTSVPPGAMLGLQETLNKIKYLIGYFHDIFHF